MERLDQYFKRIEKQVPTLQVLLESPQTNIAYQYSSTNLDQKFHSASVGKVFCATLIFQAIDLKLLALDQKICTILDTNRLENLFVFQGVDYQREVTIQQLLSHTSGINDYFEGKTTDGTKFMNLVVNNTEHVFSPKELLDFTKTKQLAVGKPNDRFLYSDAGYILLGYILESIYQDSYANILQEKICRKLGLTSTVLCFHDENFTQDELAPILFKGKEMHLANSLSCDYAGGGLQTTTKDLALFLKALFKGDLISQDALQQMMQAKHSFHGIMRYGMGMIEIDFARLMPWMRGYSKLYGGLGSISVHAFYDPTYDDIYIINLGEASKMRISFMILVKLRKYVEQMRKKRSK